MMSLIRNINFKYFYFFLNINDAIKSKYVTEDVGKVDEYVAILYVVLLEARSETFLEQV